MKKINKLLATSLFSFSFSIFAQSSLEIPKGVTIYVLNGHSDEKQDFWISSNDNIQLREGENQIVFKFKTAITQNANDVRVYDSDTIIAKFKVDSSVHAKMVMPNYWSFSEAEEGVKNLSWKMETDTGEEIPVIQDLLPSHGSQLSRDYESETIKYNSHDNPATVKFLEFNQDQEKLNQGAVVDKGIKKHTTQDKEMEPSDMQPVVSEMLKFWIQKADKKTRQEFKDYLDSL